MDLTKCRIVTRDGEITQPVMCCLSHEDLSLSPRTQIKIQAQWWVLIIQVPRGPAGVCWPNCWTSGQQQSQEEVKGILEDGGQVMAGPWEFCLWWTCLPECFDWIIVSFSSGGHEEGLHGSGITNYQWRTVRGGWLLCALHRDWHQCHGITQQWDCVTFCLLR